jgi:hypothetical protein
VKLTSLLCDIAKALGAILALPAALVLLWFAYSRYVIWRYDQPFERVERGDTQERVITLLGKPHRTTAEHQTKLAWVSGDREEYFDGESVVQFRYAPWSPAGEEYIVGFDGTRRVVSKYEITSP